MHVKHNILGCVFFRLIVYEVLFAQKFKGRGGNVTGSLEQELANVVQDVPVELTACKFKVLASKLFWIEMNNEVKLML